MGAGALKVGFTRTGKRTTWGVLNDGKNSVERFILNNFHDGFRQDAYDLFLGNHVVDSRTRLSTENALQGYGLIGGLAMGMFVLSLFAPQGNSPLERAGNVFFWFLGVFVTWKTIAMYAHELVDKPKLS